MALNAAAWVVMAGSIAVLWVPAAWALFRTLRDEDRKLELLDEPVGETVGQTVGVGGELRRERPAELLEQRPAARMEAQPASRLVVDDEHRAEGHRVRRPVLGVLGDEQPYRTPLDGLGTREVDPVVLKPEFVDERGFGRRERAVDPLADGRRDELLRREVVGERGGEQSRPAERKQHGSGVRKEHAAERRDQPDRRQRKRRPTVLGSTSPRVLLAEALVLLAQHLDPRRAVVVVRGRLPCRLALIGGPRGGLTHVRPTPVGPVRTGGPCREPARAPRRARHR